MNETEKRGKLIGETRRQLILKWLREEEKPLTGTELAKRANVSRQAVVGDINLLKARNEPIMATPSGYVYIWPNRDEKHYRRTIECQHSAEDAKAELLTLVDHGVTVENVSIQHPLYGELVATINVSNRHDVEQFVKKMRETNGTYLSQLTNGTHYHLIQASSEKQLNQACDALIKLGIMRRNI